MGKKKSVIKVMRIYHFISLLVSYKRAYTPWVLNREISLFHFMLWTLIRHKKKFAESLSSLMHMSSLKIIYTLTQFKKEKEKDHIFNFQNPKG